MKLPTLRTGLRTGLRLFVVLFVLLLCWWTLRTIHLQEIWHVLGRLTLGNVALLMLANLVVLITLNGRWWLFLYGQGYTLPFWRLLGYRVAAFAVSYFTPGPHFGGEPLQVYLVSSRHGVPTAVSIAAVTLDKMLEMVVNFMVLIAAIGLILQQQVLTDALSYRVLYTTLGLLLLPLSLLSTLGRGRYPLSTLFQAVSRRQRFNNLLTPTLSTQLGTWTKTIRHSEEQIGLLWQRSPVLFGAAISISLLSWGTLLSEFWYMTHALGFGLSFPQAVTLLFAMRVAILLPIPAGLGALEASLAIATAALGLSPATGISLSLLIRLRDVVLGIVGLWLGGFALWRRGWQASSSALVAPGEPLASHGGIVENWRREDAVG